MQWTVGAVGLFPLHSGHELPIVELNGVALFAAQDGVHSLTPSSFGDATTADYEYELYRSDGTESGTFLVKDIMPGNYGSNPYGLTETNGVVFFTADDGVHGRELWKTDGTASGTVLVKDIDDIPSEYPGSYPESLTAVNNTLFFTADDGVHGREFWKSDGTTSGTTLVKDINVGGLHLTDKLDQRSRYALFDTSRRTPPAICR